MTQSWRRWSWKLCSASWLAIGGALARVVVLSPIAFSGDCALAQITPDGTLGAESSVVTPTNINGLPSDRIDGGATRGTNLFHSFREFNVGEGRGAYFTNPAGIENILSRVTGGNPSEILGRLGVLGNGNLFLINPNGIIFGPNASLDVGGSFVGSTASSLNFTDGTQFSATAPTTTPLLTVSVPIGLQYGGGMGSPLGNSGLPLGIRGKGGTAGSILNQSMTTNSRGVLVGLQVPSGKTLALVGGDVELNGGSLYASRGRVELGGLAGAGTVGLNVDDNNLRLSYPASVQRANVSLTDGAEIYVRLGGGSGGSIAINAQNLDIAGGSKLRAGIEQRGGSVDSKAGDIEINASGAVNLTDGSFIANNLQPGATGNAGDIHITTGSLSVTAGSELYASTQGRGNAGSVTINARDTVSFDGGQRKSPNNRYSGAYSRVEGGASGQAGNIRITTGSLSVTGGAVLTTSTFGQGNGGNVTIDARDRVEFDGVSFDFSSISNGNGAGQGGVFNRVEGGASGQGGNIFITTGSLSVTGGAALTTSTFEPGNAGNVTIDARYRVEFDGMSSVPSKDGFGQSGTYSRVGVGDEGQGGNILITTGSLSVTKGAALTTSTFGSGNAGNVIIDARDTVSFDGVSPDHRFFSGTYSRVGPEASGQGGDIRITTGSLSITDGAELTTRTFGPGNAGSIFVDIDGTLQANNGTILTLANKSSGGAINITARDIRLQGDSDITTSVFRGQGSGGNINLTANSIIALDQSDILAFARDGRGGNITLNTPVFFGFRYRPAPTGTDPASLDKNGRVDINASGALSSGIITLPDVEDPSRGLVNLPAQPTDTEVAQACAPGRSQGQNEFIITGRGGLPPSPNEALDSEAIQVDWVTLDPGVEDSSSPAVSTNPTAPEPAPIVEAQGWVIGGNGEVVLTASAPTVTPHSSWQTPPAECHGS